MSYTFIIDLYISPGWYSSLLIHNTCKVQVISADKDIEKIPQTSHKY